MKYTALIADADSGLSGCDVLKTEWLNGNPAVYNYDFEVPDGTSDELVVLIARGLFWQADWTMSGTCSTVVEDLTRGSTVTVEWETDGEEVDLPSEVVLPADINPGNNDDVCNFLSDTYGWLVLGYSYDATPRNTTTKVQLDSDQSTETSDGSIKGHDVFDISDIGGHPV